MLLAFAAWALSVAGASAQDGLPYWVSVKRQALMRTGPGRTYPGVWIYVRPDLPLRVIGKLDDWRRVQDPDGTIGWMLVSLLSSRRTGMVQGEAAAPMYEEANQTSAVRYRAEPGVVGRVSDCTGGWCLFDVGGRRGYMRVEALWGVEPTETVD